MGVDGAFRYLESKGISGESVEVQDIESTIHIDVLSLLRAYISSTRKSILLGIRLKDARNRNHHERTEDQIQKECSLQLSRCVSAKLKQLGFGPGHAVLQFDGGPSIQKTKARDKRAEAAEQQTKTVQLQVLRTMLTIHLPPPPSQVTSPRNALAITTPPSRDPQNVLGEPAPSLNRARKEKVMRSAERSMKSYPSAALLDKGFLGSLMDSLSTEWEVHRCPGEADVCIPSTGCDTVATSDSDFLFHGIDTVLRQDPKNRTKFLCYNMDDIMFQLHISWPITSVVKGFSTNIDFVQKIRGASSKSEHAILADYCRTVSRVRGIQNLTPQRYQHAVSIFIRLEEDIQEASTTTIRLDQELADMITDVESFRRLYQMQRPCGQKQAAVLCSATETASAGDQVAAESALIQAPNSDGEVPKATKRPHERYMSSNKSKISTFNEPQAGTVLDLGTSSSAVKKKKTKKKSTKRERKTLYNPCSRKERQVSSDQATGRICLVRPSAIVDQVVSTTNSTVSLDCGTLGAQVKAALRHNEVGGEAGREGLAKTIVLIQELVYVGNEVTRCAQQALACYFAEVIAAHPTLSPTDRLKVENPQWVSGEGRAIIRTIDIKKGTSSVHDQFSLFWILNSHLPASKEMAFLPESGFTDSFVYITERHLIETLYANPDTPLVFGAKAENAQSHLTDHPGDLTYRLFFSPRLKYTRSTVLTSPDEDCAATAGKALLSLGDTDQRRYDALVRDLEDPNRHVESRGLFKVFLSENLHSASENKEMLDDGSTNMKYALTGTIVTNGHELQMPACGLTKKKPPSTPPPNTTRAKLDDARETFAPGQPIEDMLPDPDYVIIGIDPGICSTATATVIDTRTPAQFKNVTVSQGAQKHCTRTYMKGLNKAKRKTTNAVQLPGEEDPKARTIEELEGTITSVTCTVPINEAQGPSWSLLSQSLLDHVQSLLLVQEYLRSFYTSPMYKIKNYHRKTAIKATLNKAVDRMTSASGLTEKGDPDRGPRPIFVVGDGNFGSSKGPLLHQQFVTHLKKKSVMNKAVASNALAVDFRGTEITTPPRTWPEQFSCSSWRDAGQTSSAETMTWSPALSRNHNPKRPVEWLHSQFSDNIGI
ncbi:hypothetical protein EC968_004831, partial [Mortierella alpina]